MFAKVRWVLAPIVFLVTFNFQQDMKTTAGRDKMHTLAQIKAVDLGLKRKHDAAEEAKRKRIAEGYEHVETEIDAKDIQPATSVLME